MKVLNLGAGKIDRSRWLRDESLKEKDDFVIHVDRYFDPESSLTIAQANEAHRNCGIRLIGNTQILCKSDLFEFIDKFQYKFDLVVAERIFEHMEYVGGEIGRLLEGINMLTNENAQLEIVVPNSVSISNMLLNLESNYSIIDHVSLLNQLLIINTENHNFREDCHCSSWTPAISKFYIESEGTWKIDSIEEKIKFAGRDIYMRIKCSKT